MHEAVERILISEEDIKERVRQLGEKISVDYAGEELVLVGVLKGSTMFLADLARQIKGEVSFDFLSCSSYGDGTESTGIVRLIKDLDRPIEGKHVLVVEDIIDTGNTLHYLLGNLQSRNAKSVRLVALLDKPERRKVEVAVDYTGFVIPDHFVVGYGLDFAERFRHLPYIGILKEEVYK